VSPRTWLQRLKTAPLVQMELEEKERERKMAREEKEYKLKKIREEREHELMLRKFDMERDQTRD
jgi:hypothetical protein